MIGYISGTIVHTAISGRDITILTSSGVGYRIYVSDTSAYTLGEHSALYITTIVREDALDLYGFPTADDRELCELLMSVSGVGPKTAHNILSSTTPSLLVDAIKTRNSIYLATLPGIGKKGAEKIILELVDKVVKLSFAPMAVPTIHNDLVDALLSMGYQPRTVSEIIGNHSFESDSLQGRIREALTVLGSTK